jgi:NTE family protein
VVERAAVAHSVFGDSGLRSLISAVIGELSFEDLALPLVVLAADAATGEPVLFDSGPLTPALLASTALPCLLPAVRAQGRLLVDGGVARISAVEAAVAGGAGHLVTLRALASPYERGMVSLTGLGRARFSRAAVRDAVAHIPAIDLGHQLPRALWRALNFRHTAELITAGRAEAAAVLARHDRGPGAAATLGATA